ncbi:MAG: prepilin-type N-terminal cleavage/methylation domain-containing protein [Methylophaga sp.]|nr:prepilin-type N-terminal cleavage/methylation domain-containing protein [Methylophaga sp.]
MLSRSYHQLGFTLIELILVIVLLGIVSAVALPRFIGSSGFDERVLFDDTLNAVRYTQKVAIATGCNTRFSISANSYTVLRDDSCDSGNFSSGLTVNHPANGESSYTGKQANVSLTATQTNTTFDALGRADNNNTISVGFRRISIIAATGFSYDSTP